MRYYVLELKRAIEYAVVDTNVDRVICRCEGWYGSRQAEQIARALNESDSKLFRKLGMETQDG